MRQFILATLFLFLLVGCALPTVNSEEPKTIFGHLSEFVQLGSTEETVAYKLPVGNDFLVTIHAEVLEAQPAIFNLTVIEEKTGKQRNDLSIRLAVCSAIDTFFSKNQCDDSQTDLHTHILSTTMNNGVYVSDLFGWNRSGEWHTIITIQDSETGEFSNATFWTEVYPKRPPSSNAFELTNILLPFVTIVLFFILAQWRGWQLIKAIDET